MFNKRKLTPFLVVALCGVLAGCATVKGTVDETKFAAFTSALVELKSGIRALSDELVPLSEERFRTGLIDEIQSDIGNDDEDEDSCSSSYLSQAQLPIDTTRLNFECSPHFLTVEQFSVSVQEVMDGLISYSSMLERLSDKTLTDIETIKSQAADVNAGVASALKLIIPKEANLVDNSVSLITNAALDQMNIALKNKQISDINDAIRSNQDGVQSTVDLLRRGIVHLAQGYRIEHTEQWDQLQPNLYQDATREQAVDDIMKYIRSRFRTYAAIRELDRAVEKIPSAHAALLIDPAEGAAIAEVERLLSLGKELQQAYRNARVQDEKDALQIQATEADALADAMEARAREAQLAASKATVAWTKASINARASGDQADSDRATELEKAMQESLAEAQNKADEARALRQAAGSVQTSVNAIADSIKAP